VAAVILKFANKKTTGLIRCRLSVYRSTFS